MITMEQFLVRQPAGPEVTATDQYYLDLANRLVSVSKERGLFKSYPEKVVERAAMCVIGYYQDVIVDAGVWRSFITECRRLYGRTVPFYENVADAEYTDYELNRVDVEFMVWYAFSMNYEDKRVCCPKDRELSEGSRVWFEVLESSYDDAPLPVDYRITHELELHAAEDQKELYRLGNWLFMHCYLMTPAYALTLQEIASSINLSAADGMQQLQEKLEQSMSEDPTGPLALYLGEWLHLIVTGKMPKEPKSDDKSDHKFYTLFTKATDGKIIKFFDSYEELNRFFIDALGWQEGEEHLPQMKGRHDYILMVNREKGMLMAADISRCIAAPDNEMYDKDYARKHAIDLLTVRGCCPADLLKYVCENGWLPDAVFPGSDDTKLVADNWDFIARCYLQQYYRGD